MTVLSSKSWLSLVASAMIALALTSCALTPQDAVIQPSVRVGPIVFGAGAPVALNVVDERAGTVAGTRMMGNPTIKGAEIKVSDVAPAVDNWARVALKRNGFTYADASADVDRKLKIEVRELELRVDRAMMSVKYHPMAALKVVANNKDKVFEKMYRSEFVEGTMAPNTDGVNNRLLTDVVGRALAEMLNDGELMNFLVR